MNSSPAAACAWARWISRRWKAGFAPDSISSASCSTLTASPADLISKLHGQPAGLRAGRWLKIRIRPGISHSAARCRRSVFQTRSRTVRRQGFDVDFASLPFAALALHGNGAGRGAATGDFIHQFAVDVIFHRVAATDDFVGVPFSGGLFIYLALNFYHIDRT